jgi:CheY-like chemotaxis protein
MSCILLVDDYQVFTTALATTLRRHGVEAITAADGVEALAVLRFTRPSVIVLDLAMPELDGLELLQMLRQHPDWRDIPVVVLTALTGKEPERAKELGASLVLRKAHVSLKEIVEHVLALTPREAAA